MSNLFSTSSVLPTNIVGISEFTSEEISFTREAYEYAINFKREYNTLVRELYSNVLVSENYVIINESFSDFFGKIKKLIDKFLNFIKGLFDRFITMMAKMVKSDKHLTKNKDILLKYDDEKHKFEFEGYRFTFSEHIPMNHAAKVEFMEDFLDINDAGTSIGISSQKLHYKLHNNF